MGRFNMSEADNYGNSGGGSFFTLRDNGDTARVRFLYNTVDDIDGYAVHEVEVNGKRRYVNCIRNYNEPIDNCPLCRAGYKVIPKMFIKLYNEDAKEAQIWERGKTYFQKIASLSARYNPLCNEVIEIERSGAKGDMKTSYNFYPIENSEFDIESVECSDPLGTIILDKTADEMVDFLNTGSFPSDSQRIATQRQGGGSQEPPWDNRGGVTRRTPPQTRTRAF